MKKSTFKKVFALMLALVLTFAMSVPAFAATEGDGDDDFTITITPNDYTDTNIKNRYKAYEIFTGRLTEPDEGDEEDDLTDYEKNQLADIQWGEDIDVDAFVQALIDDEDGYFNDAFADLATDFAENFDSAECAAKVAEILANVYKDDARTEEDDLDPDDFAKKFAVVAQKNLKDPGAKPVESDFESDEFTITVDKPGYYLIVDDPDSTPKKGDIISEHLLQVVRDRTLKLKSDTPTVEKEIASGNGGYEIGEPITFQLTGTLAKNFKNFLDAYYYAFIDTMSDGLTLDKDSIEVNVYSVKEDGTLDQVKITDENLQQYYEILPDDEEETEADYTFAVVFEDLKEIEELEASYVIVVTYDAFINDETVIGTYETNEVYVKFSNNPNYESSGEPGEPEDPPTTETPKDEVAVQTFELDIIKKDSVNNEKLLEGVKFHLYKVETVAAEGPAPAEPTTKTLYGVFDDGGDGTYTLKTEGGWTEYEDEDADGWTDEATATDLITIEGGILNLKGLGEGVYYLEEVEGLNGYNTLPGPIKITITADYYEAEDDEVKGEEAKVGEVKNIYVTVTINDEDSDLVSVDEDRDGVEDTSGLIPLDVLNVPASSLPSTGGIGNYIFYIGGGLLIAAAVAFFFISRRKSSKEA